MGGMLVESVALLCTPLSCALQRPHAAICSSLHAVIEGKHCRPTCCLSIGAGIYEELVFRLTGLRIAQFSIGRSAAFQSGLSPSLLMVGITAAWCSPQYHYWRGIEELFNWRTFAYFAQGLEFILPSSFTLRGFGITVWFSRSLRFYCLCSIAFLRSAAALGIIFF